MLADFNVGLNKFIVDNGFNKEASDLIHNVLSNTNPNVFREQFNIWLSKQADEPGEPDGTNVVDPPPVTEEEREAAFKSTPKPTPEPVEPKVDIKPGAGGAKAAGKGVANAGKSASKALGEAANGAAHTAESGVGHVVPFDGAQAGAGQGAITGVKGAAGAGVPSASGLGGLGMGAGIGAGVGGLGGLLAGHLMKDENDPEDHSVRNALLGAGAGGLGGGLLSAYQNGMFNSPDTSYPSTGADIPSGPVTPGAVPHVGAPMGGKLVTSSQKIKAAGTALDRMLFKQAQAKRRSSKR